MRYLLFLPLLLAACADPAASSVTSRPAAAAENAATTASSWDSVATVNAPTARHEAAFVAVGDKAYLLGGRGIKPVDVYDPATKTWTSGAPSPVEIHHFQPVVYKNEIYLLGAMTGPWPDETALPDVYVYNPARDEWRTAGPIPADRRRGGAGALLHDGKIYLVCGIVNGHRSGHVPWLDTFDPTTGEWTVLPDAPRARDHFQAVYAAGKIYAPAGRRTGTTESPFGGTEPLVDAYDLATRTWTTLTDTLPTPRAGNAAIFHDGSVLVLGGESTAHEVAHNEVEALDVATGTWSTLAPLSRGRHGTGVVYLDGKLMMASGCGNRGGSPELGDVIVRE